MEYSDLRIEEAEAQRRFSGQGAGGSPPQGRGCLKVIGIIALALFGLILVVLVGLGIAMELGFVPNTVVLAGSELRDSTLEQLRSHGVLEDDETIQYFYSAGFLSVLEDGNFFTERRVISYADLGGDAYYESARFEDVADIEVQYSSTWIEDSVITVHTDDENFFQLLVSREEKKDFLFFKALTEAWRKVRPEAAEASEELPEVPAAGEEVEAEQDAGE